MKGGKPFYLQWWFYVGIVLLAGILFVRFQVFSEPSSQEPETKVYKRGEQVESGGLLITVHRVQQAETIEGYKGEHVLRPNHQYVLVEITVQNQSQEGKKVYLYGFPLVARDWVGDVLPEELAYVNRQNPSFYSRMLRPGEAMRGQLIYEVPKYLVNDKDLHFSIPAKVLEMGDFRVNKEVALNG